MLNNYALIIDSFMELQQTYMKAIFIVFMRQNIVNGEIDEPLCKVIQNNLSIYFLSTMPTSVIKILKALLRSTLCDCIGT